MKTFAALAALGMALFATPALASDEILTILNQTGYTISEIYISPTKANNWEEDVLAEDVLPTDHRTRVDMSNSADTCKWDVRVVYDDGEDAYWQNLDFCEISLIALHYNDKTGDTWADTE